MSPLTDYEARVIRVWRVDFSCSYERIAGLVYECFGYGCRSARAGADYCEEARLLLGDTPESWALKG
jgi:hypothetical protein